MPLRVIILFYFVFSNIHNPRALIRKLRVITRYRRIQETLREFPHIQKDCLLRQFSLTAETTKESLGFVSTTIKEWFEKKPLPFLSLCRRIRMKSTIRYLHRKGIKLGVYSDYPIGGKLHFLGISQYISTILSADDPFVYGFKPNTNGFIIAANRMELDPSEVLYVGDRPEVDGAGARRAGMQVIILRNLLKKKGSAHYPSVSSFNDLVKVLKA